MKIKLYSATLLAAIAFASCNAPETNNETEEKTGEGRQTEEFQYTAEQFADLKLIRYQVPGFEELDAKKKELLYYLYEAALCGRDIIYDQNYVHNIQIRKTLESIVRDEAKYTENEEYAKLLEYTKRVWFSNGIHHHYSNAKFEPTFSKEFFVEAVNAVADKNLPLKEGESKEQLLTKLTEVIFNPEVAAKKVSLEADIDIVQASAVNFYGADVTQKEVEEHYNKMPKVGEDVPEYGLNTQLVKENGEIVAKTWKVDGMYDGPISKIVYWLEKAIPLAENEQQELALERLMTYYITGSVEDWDLYNIAWVNDTNSVTDVVNGFIEVYNDPLGYKGSFESVVSFKDMEATKRIEAVSKEAQWFEDNAPIMDKHKKANVKGITGKVITVVVESGDASPSTPIGINLPNNNWIREYHGSKSVSLGNIVHAYDMSSKEGKSSLAEFAYSQEEIDRSKKYGGISDLLHTDLHEVIGHASGTIDSGVGTPKETLKNYASTLEEGRADLVALYYLYDQKLVNMGLMESLESGKTAYDGYIKNGMMLQLKRLEVGDQVEEAHMRNRQLIAQWTYEKGKAENVIEKKTRDGKTYFVINDYSKLRTLFGDLLRELQRIKSEGDYEAGKALVETYAVKVDPELHAEVLERYSALGVAPYGGFINPKLVATETDGKISGVEVQYPTDFKEQMMYYGENYSFIKLK